MKNKITGIYVKVEQETTLPDGVYNGVWGGYEIHLTYNDKEYVLETGQVGVKGFNISVIVEIKDGIATFEEIKR